MSDKKQTYSTTVVFFGLLLLAVLSYGGFVLFKDSTTQINFDSSQPLAEKIKLLPEEIRRKISQEVSSPQDFAQNLQKLKTECAALSKETGEEHFVVVGRYLASKSEIRTISAGNQKPIVNIKMVFDTHDGETKVHTGFEDVGDEYKKRKEMLANVVGEHFFAKTDTDHHVGLCARKNNADRLTGKIEDLRKIGSPE